MIMINSVARRYAISNQSVAVVGVVWWRRLSSASSMTDKQRSSEIIFLGTGSSVGTPNIFHLMFSPRHGQNFDSAWDVSK
jgi:hypothetical protein